MSFADTILAFLPRWRRPDGQLAEAVCDADGSLRVTLVRERAGGGVWVDPEGGAALVNSRVLSSTAGRTLRRLLVCNAGPELRWFQLFDFARAVAPGAQPIVSWPLAPNGAVALDVGRTFVDGVAWAASTTPGTHTPDANARFWVSTELSPTA